VNQLRQEIAFRRRDVCVGVMFEFYKLGAPFPLAWIAKIPKGISGKGALLRTVAKGLRFPAYFGMNWAALDECLADLEWLEGSAVWLWHEDVPLSLNHVEAKKYLSILSQVAGEPGSKLRVAFPESLRDLVTEILSSN
jgi:hypothetical protein